MAEETLTLKALIARAQRTQSGFTDLRAAADNIYQCHSAKESLRLAKRLLASEVHQARMIGTFVLGRLAAKANEALKILREQVSQDEDWRVQEILAQAFDHYCADIGYERALPTIQSWLQDANPNVRRAASEGLRIWTARPYLKAHPEVAVRLLSCLKDDPSEYVRTSAGNALRDISRKHADLVRAELQGWDVSNKAIAQTYRLAGRFVLPLG